MKFDKEIKLADVIQFLVIFASVVGLIVTIRVQVSGMQRDRDEDHALLVKMSGEVSGIAEWKAATDVRVESLEREVRQQVRTPARTAQSPHREAAINAEGEN